MPSPFNGLPRPPDSGSWWDRTPAWIRWPVLVLLVLYMVGGLIAGTVGLLRVDEQFKQSCLDKKNPNPHPRCKEYR